MLCQFLVVVVDTAAAAAAARDGEEGGGGYAGSPKTGTTRSRSTPSTMKAVNPHTGAGCGGVLPATRKRGMVQRPLSSSTVRAAGSVSSATESENVAATSTLARAAATAAASSARGMKQSTGVTIVPLTARISW